MSEKFNIEPGQRVVEVDEDTLLLFDRPDWCIVPDELGGGKRYFERVEKKMCKCGRLHEAVYYYLKGDDNLVVIECVHIGWMWAKKQTQEGDDA